jgi:hypothetical protein
MDALLQLGIGMLALVVSFFLGGTIAKIAKDELKIGHKWFEVILLASFLGAILSLIFLNDVLMFSFLFILIFTFRSINTK